jgi:hypothetical protein
MQVGARREYTRPPAQQDRSVAESGIIRLVIAQILTPRNSSWDAGGAKKEYTPFPPAQLPSKTDLQLEGMSTS